MSMQPNLRTLKAACLLPLLSMALLEGAYAAIAPSAFGERYQAVPTVAQAQSQVVYYRLGTPGEKAPAANLYVDREFHTSLLPGGYAVFCVAPGAHGLNAVQDDAPGYAGKQRQPSLDLPAGKTLFLRVSEQGGQAPQPVSREVAEKELAGSLRQAHVVSRAASVKPCDYPQQPKQRSYSVSSDLLFDFGRAGQRDLGHAAGTAIGELSRQIRQDNAADAAIEVVGHTDRIGGEKANEALGLRRAQTVRQLLIDNGIAAQRISARSAGSREPVSQDCRGDRAALIACYAPDRRVVIHVRAQGES